MSLKTVLFTMKINVGKFFLNEITNARKNRCLRVRFRCFFRSQNSPRTKKDNATTHYTNRIDN